MNDKAMIVENDLEERRRLIYPSSGEVEIGIDKSFGVVVDII